MSPWWAFGALAVGVCLGFVSGVIAGVSSERIGSYNAEQEPQKTPTELSRERSRRAHPTYKPNPWN